MSALDTPSAAPPQPGPPEDISVAKTMALTASGDRVEVFTMTLGGETISLLPLKNWSQLDLFKWRARGKVPGTPAGLEIALDHVKVTGETVLTKDPNGAAKLQKLLNAWLAFAKGNLEMARQKGQPKPAAAPHEASVRPENLLPRVQVEVDKEGHVHIHCFQGKELLASIGLNLPGLASLVSQGLLHKPRSLLVGALHDWIELDGEFFSFEKGNNDSARLEKTLNERYLSTAALGQGKEVVVFPNAASSTGFDIQFAAMVGGVPDHRKRPLNEESLALLQSPDKCGLLPKDLVIKLSPPNLIFKCKTPDGGERYLNRCPENIVTVIGDEGETKTIDLSQPVNCLRLTAVELTAVFNHPAINQHSRASPQPEAATQTPSQAHAAPPPAAAQPIAAPATLSSQPAAEAKPADAPKVESEASQPREPAERVPPKPGEAEPAARPAHPFRTLPNLWLAPILGRRPVPHAWFTCLVYTKLAEHFGNSSEAHFGPIPCWACSLGEVDDVCAPGFRGVFLTQKGGLAYLNRGHIARFHNEVAFVGTLESSIEGIGVKLVAIGMDLHGRIVFVVTEGYRTHFGIPEQTVAEELARLREHGALVMSVNEVLHSLEPIQVVWTVPADQEDADDPQAEENLRPGSGAAEPSPVEGRD